MSILNFKLLKYLFFYTQDTVTYSVNQNASGSDGQYVFINPTTGVVTIAKMFKKEARSEYLVC